MLHQRTSGRTLSVRSLSLLSLFFFGLILFAAVIPNHMAHAAPAAPVVDILDDEDDGVCTPGDCSLREAIAAAAPDDTVTFSVNGTIVLSSGLGELVIGKNLTIDGGGNIIVSGNNAVRVFNVTSGNVTFDDLTIENGKFNGVVLQCGIASEKGGGADPNDGANVTVKNSTFTNNTADCGGAILNDGTLTVEKSIFENNDADFLGGAIDNRFDKITNVFDSTFANNTAVQLGGGINNYGTLGVTRSTFSGNESAGSGGGIYNQFVLTMTNSTLSGNVASFGGGIYGICNDTVVINNSTITDNRASSAGGGIVSEGGSCGGSPDTILSNSIVSGNVISGTTAADDLGLSAGTTNSFSSGGNNLIGTLGSGVIFAGSGDQINVNDPKLDPLADNGGATFTHALQADSLAIDNGECSGGPATDQRGVARPQNATCDVGAYEKEQPPVADFSGTPTSGVSPLEVTFTNLSTGNITEYVWMFGDGGASNEINPTHTYATAGSYTVALTVNGPGGDNIKTKSDYITVTDPVQPPTADFSGTPTSGTAPLEVNFSNLSTGDISTYAWTFGDGGVSTEANPSHTYTAAGDYDVSLTATGPGGVSRHSKFRYISVDPPPPTADFSATPRTGNRGVTVSFTDLSSGDVTNWAWVFGDDTNGSNEQNPSHTYYNAGVYNILLQARGPGGFDVARKSRYIDIEDPNVNLDLKGDYLEVTQGIQDLTNAVRLVANKRTFVRFHVSANSAGNHSTTAELELTRSDGKKITVKPVTPTINVPLKPDRGVLNHAFLFELPDDFREGTVAMVANLNPKKNIAERGFKNNYVEHMATFEPVPTVNLVFYALYYDNGEKVYPKYVHRGNFFDWLRRAYPLSDLKVIHRTAPIGKSVPKDALEVLPELSRLRILDLNLKKRVVPTNSHYYGMVDDSGGFMRGRAFRPGYVGAGPAGDPTGPGARLPQHAWDKDGSYADWYGGHELGHTYGRPHADYCGATDGIAYPYPKGRISPELDGTKASYGFDIHKQAIYGPTWHDVMTYCTYQWISKFTYEALLDAFQFASDFTGTPTSGAAPLTVKFTDSSRGDVTGWSWDFGDGSNVSTLQNPSHTYTSAGVYSVMLTVNGPAGKRARRRPGYITVTASTTPLNDFDAANSPTDRLLVVGSIDLETMAVDLLPLFVVPDADDVEPATPGDYAIVLRSSAGDELARYPITPDEMESGPAPTDEPATPALMISELVPYVNGTTQVDIEKSGSVLSTVTAGAATPSVTVTSPNGGETLSGDTFRVAWTASDPDGDALVFDVQYSADGGQEWETVYQFVDAREVDIDAVNMPGSDQGLFRVVVSDGIHTAYDDSDNTFTVPNREPTVEIFEPVDGATVVISATIGLRGDAFDTDTGTMTSDQVQWSSDRDGVLGNGQQVSVADLSEGLHTITFRADDGDNGMAETSVQITVVSDDTPLPDALLAGPTTIIFDPESDLTSSSLSIDNQHAENSIGWAAATSESWVQLDASAGTTPDTINVTFADSGLAPGFHSAVVTFTSPDTPGQSQDVNVSVTIAGSEESRYVYLPMIQR